MPVRRRRKKKEAEHAYVALKVESYEAETGASINHYAYGPQYAWNYDDRDPLTKFTIRLTIAATATWPETRAGEKYDLTIYGDDSPSLRHNATLKDVQARDRHGVPQYREYRGRHVPILNPPKGIGTLDKIRGEPRWTAGLFVPTSFAGNLLALLDRDRNLFLSIHERKEDRVRWILSISLQTTDPSEE